MRNKTGEVTTGAAMLIESIVVGAFQCNCLIIADEDTRETIVIDPGDEPEQILEIIRHYDLTVKYTLHTHAHLDHIMGTRALKEALGPELLLHAADAFLYDHLVDQAAQFGWHVAAPVGIDRFMTEGDEVRFGQSRVTVLHTPGHTPGSVCFQMPETTPILFAGDTLFAGSIGRTDLPGGSYDSILRSIHDKLLPLQEDTIVYPGHGPQTTIWEEKRHNPFLI